MASIYDLTEEVLTLWALMESGELDDEMLIGAMEYSQEELHIKIESYCKWIKNMESDIAGLKAEEERLKDKRKTMENTIDRAKKAMKAAMEVTGEKKIKGQIFTISIQANPESVVLDESYIENIPPEYLKVKEPEIDKVKLKEDLKNGVNLDGIAHLEQTESLRIK